MANLNRNLVRLPFPDFEFKKIKLLNVLEGVLDLGLGAVVPGSHADDRHLDAVAELQGLGHDGGEVGDGQLERKRGREV